MKLYAILPDGTEARCTERRGKLWATDPSLPDYATHPHFKGFALSVYGRACTTDDDSYWTGAAECDPDEIIVCMVGDDVLYSIPLSECTTLADDDDGPAFCLTCGQLGCHHGRY